MKLNLNPLKSSKDKELYIEMGYAMAGSPACVRITADSDEELKKIRDKLLESIKNKDIYFNLSEDHQIMTFWISEVFLRTK